jgi:hypothetical protein
MKFEATNYTIILKTQAKNICQYRLQARLLPAQGFSRNLRLLSRSLKLV